MANKFLTIMELIGKDAKIALADIVKYLPEGAALATIIFPAQAATIAGVVDITNLVQQTVTLVEQKMAGSTGTSAQKLADVLQIVTPTVTSELEKAGIKADTAYITNIVNAIVAILNVQTTTVTA